MAGILLAIGCGARGRNGGGSATQNGAGPSTKTGAGPSTQTGAGPSIQIGSGPVNKREAGSAPKSEGGLTTQNEVGSSIQSRLDSTTKNGAKGKSGEMIENRVKEERLVEKVFVVNIVQDERKLKEYLSYHQKVWPEVEAGFRKAGYRQIDLYRYGYLLVMIIRVPEHADLDKMGKIAEGYDSRCAEWNRIMGGYQRGVAGAAPGVTWVEATPFYHFENQRGER